MDTTPRFAARATQLHSLTGVRAVAAVAVFFAHVRWILPADVAAEVGDRRIELADVLTWGGTGVSLFFVLSGFVLTWTWSDATTTRTFYVRRVGRIWPAHAVAALAFLALELAGAASRSPAPAVVAVFLLLQGWFPGSGWANAVNPAAWTLSCEAFFYVLFPFLVGPVRRLDRRGLVALAVVPWLATLVVHVAVLVPRGIAVSTFPPLRLAEFLAGMAVGHAVATLPGLRFPSLRLTGAVMTTYLVASTQVSGLASAVEVALPLGFALVIGRLATADLAPSEAGTVLRHPLVRRAGEVSYCFYLVHLLPLVLIGWWRDGDPRMSWGPAIAVAAVWFVVAWVAAWMLHRAVEAPIADWVRART